MNGLRDILPVVFLAATLSVLPGCSAEVGSERWCTQMKDKPKGEWSANDVADFARHCVLKGGN